MDIPLPDEIPLPGGGDDNQPGPPGEGPTPMRGGNFQRAPGQQGPQMMPQNRPSPGLLVPPPMFRGALPSFMQAPPPPNPVLEENSSRPASERYSPSRVTADDDEKEQLSISAIFAQEQNLQHSTPLPPSQSNSQPQQSISAIFDSFLAPPPQSFPPAPPHSHEQPPGNRFHPIRPQFPMGGQHPPHGRTGMPPGPRPPPPPGHHAPYYTHPPPYQPYTSAPVNRPPFNPIYTPASGNKINRPYKPVMHQNTSYFHNSKSKASRILKSFNVQNPPYSHGTDVASTSSEVVVTTTSDSSITETTLSTVETPTVETESSVSAETDKSLPSEEPKTEESDISVPGVSVEESAKEDSVAENPKVIVPEVVAADSATAEVMENPPVSISQIVPPIPLASGTKMVTDGTTENNETESVDKPIKKIMPKVLGKHGAKKRLLSYTGKLSAFSLAKTTKTTAANLEEDDDSNEKKKVLAQAKKKKKEEKMSSIEQIRNEESRIKEALGLKNVLFSPYGPGLAPITKLLDNPEELRKFEVRGKQAKIKLEEYEERSKIREKEEKKKDLLEKDKEKKLKDKEEKDKENEKLEEGNPVSASGVNEGMEHQSDTKTEPEEPRKKSHVLPKTWKEFKVEKYDLEGLRQAIREEQRRRRSRSHDRTRSHGSYTRERRESKQEEIDTYGQQNQALYPVRLKSLNGMRLQYPAKMVQYTKSLPSVSYGVNYHRFSAHYSTRREIREKEPPELWEIMEDFWSSKPVYPRNKKHGKGVARPWFGEELGGKSSSKAKPETETKEEGVKKPKTEKKSKKSHSRHKVPEKKQEAPQIVEEKDNVNQEVAKAATKSRWDSDNEEGDGKLQEPEAEDEITMLTPSKSNIKNGVEEDATTENEIISSDNNTNNAEGVELNEPSGKSFPEGLNEEYEAFLEILGGGSNAKENEKEENLESVSNDEKDNQLAEKDKDEDEIEPENKIYPDESEIEKNQEEPDVSDMTVLEEDKKIEGKVDQEKKKDKADKKLKKQLKKAKKKQKKAKKKAKRKAKKVVKKKKVSKKETKKNEKKDENVVPVIDEESDASVIHLKDDNNDVERNSERRRKRRDSRESRDNSEDRRREVDVERNSERRRKRKDSGDSRDYSEERRRELSSNRKRDSDDDRSSVEKSEYADRRRRDSPERREEYDRRRGPEERRDFNYRREGGGGRGYFRGRGGGDWRREEFGDFRGRYRGRGGYERRGRGGGFMRNFNYRDRRDSFRERRIDFDEKRDDERMYERTEDYEVHREFIREKRFEWKEALEEGRDLRKERQKRKGDLERRRKEHKSSDDLDDVYCSPARTISDESDDDVKSVDNIREVDTRGVFDDDKPYSRGRREKRLPSPAPSPSPSPSPSPERIMKSEDLIDLEEEERSRKIKKKTVWDLEESNTNHSWKSKESSPSHIIEDLTVDDEKDSATTRYPTSDTSGYYDLSSAPSPLSEPDSAKTEEKISNVSKKKGKRSKKDVEVKLDDIPYPPGGPPTGDKRKNSLQTQPVSDRYSPSNMSMSASPTSSSPYNSPRSHSPSLEIPLPLSIQSIPVPPTKKTATSDPSHRSDLKGISIPPSGIPLPSGPPHEDETTEVPKLATPVPAPIAVPGKSSLTPGQTSTYISQLAAPQISSVPAPVVVTTAVPSILLTTISKAYSEVKGSVASSFNKEGTESVQQGSQIPSKPQDLFNSSRVPIFPSATAASISDSEPTEFVELKQSVIELQDKARSDEPIFKSDQLSTKWVERSVDESHINETVNDDKIKSSRSVPIAFRLGGSKQAAIKRLQKGSALAEFDHDDEEEEKAGMELERDEDDKVEYGSGGEIKDVDVLQDGSSICQPRKSTPPPSPKTVESVNKELQLGDAKETERSDRSRSRSMEKGHSTGSYRSPQRNKNQSRKDASPHRSQSPERSKSPKGSRGYYKNKSPPRGRSPVRSRSPQRNRSPKRNRSPRRSRDSRSRSWSPKRMAGRRSPPRKRRVSPEYRRFRGSPERGRRREFGSPRRTGRWLREGRSPPPRVAGQRSGKDRRSPKRFSHSPSPLKVGDRFTSPDSRRSRSPDKTSAPVAQGPRTPEGPDKGELGRSPPARVGSPHREREFRGTYKEKLGSRSPERPPSLESVGRRPYPSSPGGRKVRKDYRLSRSPGSRSPESWHPRRISPGRRSPGRQRVGSPSWRSPPYRSPDGRSQYSPSREKISPARRWSPMRSRSPRRSPLRKSSPRRPQMLRSTSRSPIRRSRSRSPIRRSGSRSPVRRSPLRRSPRWSRSPGRWSPVRRSPVRRSPSRRSPLRSPLRRSPIRRSPLRRSPSRRSPLRKSPQRKSPRRSPRSSRSPSKEFDYERHERGSGWSNWKWDKEKEQEHKDQERWPARPPSPKKEPPPDKYYKKKAERKEGTVKIDADSTISDSELVVVKKEPVDSSSSPQDSPRRLSLDERLQQEHGVNIEDHSKKKRPPQHTQPPLYNWGYQAHPVQVHQFQYAYEGSSENVPGEGGTGEGSSRVIQVGNMLQVLPQDPGTTATQPSMIVQQVLPQEGGTATTPSPMIVQTGNVIQVVPAENMQMVGADAATSGGVMGMGGVVQVVTGGMMGMPGSSPTPVPAPVTSTATASSSKSVSDDAASAVSSVLSSLSSIQLPGSSVLTSVSSVNQLSNSSSVAPVTTLATNSVTATTSTHTAGLPVAHLISLLQQQQQLASMNESMVDQEAKAAAKEKAREERRERKEKRRLEREARREARNKGRTSRHKHEQAGEDKDDNNQNSDTEDEVLIREAIYEVPNIGSPVPEYEIMQEEDEEEDEEEALRKKRRLPIPLPPAEKGILMSPSYRYRDEYHPKAVKFADGILPGEGTSPSGGEEIHSPPPPGGDTKRKEKKLRKRRKVKVKVIKEYKINDEDNDSPPPPPPSSPPPQAALKLYPGYTHYSYTAPGTVVIYAHQPQQAYAFASGQPQGAVTVPGGMVIQQGTNAQPAAAAAAAAAQQAALGNLGGVSPGVFRYPGYVYTTVYSAGQQLQYVLPSSLTSQPTTSSSPQKTSKK